MSSTDFVKDVLAGFADTLQPLRDAVASPDAFTAFLKQFGWTLKPEEVASVLAALHDIATLAADPSSLSLDELTHDLVAAATAVRKVGSSSAPAAFVTTFPRELLDFLVYVALTAKVRPLFGLLHFAGIVSEQRVPANAATGRAEYIERQVQWDRLGPLADDPLGTIESAYGWGTPAFDGDALVRSIATLAGGFGAHAGMFVPQPQLVNEYFAPNSPSAVKLRSAVVSLPGLDQTMVVGGAQSILKLAMMAMPIPPSATVAAGLDGVVVMPLISGKAADTINLTDSLSIKLAGDFLARPVRAEFHPGRSVLRATPGDTRVDASARLDAKAPAAGPWIPIGSPTSSRLEVSAAHVAIGLTGTLDSDLELTAEVGIDTAALVIDFGESDSLMQNTVSKQPARSALSLTVKWSSKSGFSLGGQPRLQIKLPLQQSLAGVATLQQIGLALGPAPGNRLEFDATLTGTTSIGPVTLEVQDVGLALFLTPSGDADPPGVLGNIHFDFGFKSPSGVGLAVDVAGLTGGGFLSHDDAAAQYAGMLQLVYQQFQLQAFGLVATRLPTGPGYSLVAMIDANFPPIELVAGFTLNGVGGLLGIHRTISKNALQAALKAHTLSNFLFAKNPVANAAQLLTDLATFFPAADGRYVFGPLLQIGWGTPTLVTIDLALILELPDPVRLVLIGELAVLLPVPDAALLELHMDVLGTIDFGTEEGSLDAVLHDSRLVRFPLHGGMALRGCWAGSDQTFLLAVGGFHPKFQPPPGFPALDRLAVSMPSGPISKLNLNGYIAVSSNTLQIGAHVDMFVGVDGFGISGYLNFDTLIARNPFYFDGDISGGVTLSAGGDDLMTLDLSGELTGPAPWHVSGSVHFSVLGFGVTKSFSATFGDPASALDTTLVDVGAALRGALSDPRNFTATLTGGQNGLVSLRTPVTSGVALGHPGASLTVNQRVVPLDLTIQKFGAGAPQGESLFSVTTVTVDGFSQPQASVSGEFAPAQFLDLSDDDELAAPSFEAFDSGVSVAAGALAFGPVTTREISYETWLVDAVGAQPREDTGITLPPNRVTGILTGLLNSGLLRYAAPSQAVLRSPTLQYVVATTDQIAASGVGAATGQSYAQARAALAAALQSNPDQRGALQVVAEYEVQ
jgi:hypothetical protein